MYSEAHIANLEVDGFAVDDASIEEILDTCLEDTGLTFFLDDNIVVIRKKPTSTALIEGDQQEEQKITITGTVKDDKGEPLPFVAIVIKGTTTGCMSAVDGTYSMEVTHEESIVLEISSLGYMSQEIPVDGRTAIDIVLVEDNMGLEEVVVVGYGGAKRERIGSAISEIKSEAIEEQAMGVTSFENVLGGNIKGLQVSQGSGAPGSAASIRIRGITSPFSGGNNQPLYVVDGVEFNTDPQGEGATNFSLNPLESINPNDIKRCRSYCYLWLAWSERGYYYNYQKR